MSPIAAGRQLDGKWQGCMDHILELTTGLAFDESLSKNGTKLLKAKTAATPSVKEFDAEAELLVEDMDAFVESAPPLFEACTVNVVEVCKVMKKTRALVGHVISSTRSHGLLMSLQGANGVTVIQDVVTRWWSTFAMCNRLLELEGYFKVMEVKSADFAPFNLTALDWAITD